VGHNGGLIFDPSKPDGTPRKVLDVSRISNLGWKSKVSFTDGIARAYADYLERL
jgi:GDP-L-fucose synthase